LTLFRSKFYLALLSLFVTVAYAQDKQWRTMDEIKTWHLQVGNSRVEVKLSSFVHVDRPQNTVVSFLLEDGDPVLTVAQIAELLGRVLNEMPDLGYAPEKLGRIAFPSWASDVESGINLAVVRSGQWKSCIGLKTCYSIHRVISDHLSSSEALRPLEPILEAHHLEQNRVSIDDPGCGLVPSSTPRAVEVGTRSLSCGGLILVDLQPI